jgi:hypothetical protein
MFRVLARRAAKLEHRPQALPVAFGKRARIEEEREKVHVTKDMYFRVFFDQR